MPYDYDRDLRYRGLLGYLRDSGFSGHPRFYELLARMACTHADKNHDYAGDEDPFANCHECESYGISAIDGVVTRLTDKDSRFKNWLKGRRAGRIDLRVKDEGILDTLQDRAVYTVILMVLIEEARAAGEGPKTGSTLPGAGTVKSG